MRSIRLTLKKNRLIQQFNFIQELHINIPITLFELKYTECAKITHKI